MPSLRVFLGARPRIAARLLASGQAAIAQNAKLWSGVLKAWAGNLQTFALTKPGTILSIYWYLGQYWFHWTTAVSVVRTPVAGQATNLVYFTGDGVPKYTDQTVATQGGGTDYPITSYQLGVPAPAAAVAAGVSPLGGGVTGASAIVATQAVWGDAFPSEATANVAASSGAPLRVTAKLDAILFSTAIQQVTFTYKLFRGATEIASKTDTFNARGSVTEPLEYAKSYEITYDDDTPGEGAVAYKATLALTGSGSGAADIAVEVKAVQGTFVAITTNKKATGKVTLGPSLPIDNDTVTIGGQAYRFKNVLAAAYDVKIGGTLAACASNLDKAIDDDGVEGTDYGTGTVAHPTVTATIGSVTSDVSLEARTAGYAGNAITLSEASANITVSGATLSGAVHGLEVGDTVAFSGVTGMLDLNGTRTVLGVGTTGVNVDLDTSQVYAAGGTWTRVAAVTTDADPVVTAAWVYTYVAVFGGVSMEGPPSPASVALTHEEDEDVSLTGFSAPPGGRNITKIRVYRAVTGTEDTEFLFVKEVDVGTSPVVDDVPAASLGEALESEDWLEPPTDLEGLVEMPDGVLAGFRGNEICFCEPYQPHAWPLAYRRSVPAQVRALIPAGNQAVIATDGLAWIIGGAHPEQYGMDKLETAQACVSKRSAVDMGDYAVYASADGLVGVRAGVPTLLTEGLFSQDEWSALKPDTLLGTRYNNAYVGFYDQGGGVKGGFMLDPRDPINTYTTLDFHATGAFHDRANGDLYLVVGSNVVKFDGDPNVNNRRTYTYRSAPILHPSDGSFGAVQVEAEGYPVTLKVILDGTEILSRSVAGIGPVRLPPKRGREWQVELTGTVTVKAVHLARTIEDLRRS